MNFSSPIYDELSANDGRPHGPSFAALEAVGTTRASKVRLRTPYSPLTAARMSKMNLLPYVEEILLPTLDTFEILKTPDLSLPLVDVQLEGDGLLLLRLRNVMGTNCNRERFLMAGFKEVRPMRFERRVGACPLKTVLLEALTETFSAIGQAAVALTLEHLVRGEVRERLRSWIQQH